MWNILINNKNKIIRYSCLISLILLILRVALLLSYSINSLIEVTLISLISFISIFVMLLAIYPKATPLKEYILKYKELLIFNLHIFLCEYLFVLANKFEYLHTRFFAILFIIALMNFIFILIPRTAKKISIIFLIIFIPIYINFQHIYYSIFTDIASFKEIVTFKEGIESSSGVVHFTWLNYVLLFLMVISLLLYIKYEQDIRYPKTSKKFPLLKGLLIFFFILNINLQIPPKTARLYLSDHYLYYSIFNKEKTAKTFGLVNYMYRDLVDSLTPKIPNKKSIEKVSDYYDKSPLKNHQQNQYSGVFEGKNLIIIMAESYDDKLIDPELTPSLNKLRDESLQFTNHKVPVYPRTTSDTEFIVNTGLIPSIVDGPTCYMFNKNQFSQSLANLFNEKGYLTRGFHSNTKEFYTRYMVYDGFGYNDFYGKKEIPSLPGHNRFDGLFLNYGKNLMLPEKEPFMSFIMTLSGHSPYNDTNKAATKNLPIVDKKYGDSLPKEIKYYLATQLEVENLVSNLFKALEEKNMLEDTVIVFTNDHYPYTIQGKTYEDYTGLKENYEKMTGPLYIWSKNIQPTKINTLTSTYNLLPTLANMFNLPAQYQYYFGTDVFSKDYKPLAVYKDRSWYDGVNYVKDGKKKIGTAKEDYINNTTNSINEAFEIGKLVLRTDYFRSDKLNFNKDK